MFFRNFYSKKNPISSRKIFFSRFFFKYSIQKKFADGVFNSKMGCLCRKYPILNENPEMGDLGRKCPIMGENSENWRFRSKIHHYGQNPEN